MTDVRKKLDKHYARCGAHFEKLYAPQKTLLVFGDGNPCAPVMLVGEAPGEQEALKGRPFVGKAGKLLDDLLAAIGLTRADLFVTNTVKLRPTAVSKAMRTVNRAPTAEEVALFLPWLLGEIDIIRPKLIVTLGNVPFKALSGLKGAAIGGWHGRVVEPTPCGAPLFALYHPAALIYRKGLMDSYQADLAALSAHIDQGNLRGKGRR